MTQDQPVDAPDLADVPQTPSSRAKALERMVDAVIAVDANRVSGPPQADVLHYLPPMVEALERLTNLADRQPQPRPGEERTATPTALAVVLPAAEVDDLRAILVAAIALIEAIDGAGLERDHFTGVLDVIPPCLERLEAAVDAVEPSVWTEGNR